MQRKELIYGAIKDAVTDLLYYDRKEDEDLPVGAIEAEIRIGGVTVEELARVFEDALRRDLER